MIRRKLPLLCILVWLVGCISATSHGAEVNDLSIECPATQSDIRSSDFSRNDCRPILLPWHVMSETVAWVQFEIHLTEHESSLLTPLGLFISGNMSLDAYVNGHYIGSKGKPSLIPAEEVIGPFDWVGYVDNTFVNEGPNLVTLFVSSHNNIVSRKGYFNRLYMAEFGDTTEAYYKHYAPSLIPLGALLIALTYLLSQRFSLTSNAISNSLLTLLVIAIAQLLIEVSRGIYSYPYPLQLVRLYMIATCSFLFGHCLLYYSLRSSAHLIKISALVSSITLTLIAQYLTVDFDNKAIVAIQIPSVIGVLAMLTLWFKGTQDSGSYRVFVSIYASLILITMATQSEFLDSYFYFFIAALLMILTKLESDKIRKMEYALGELKQEAKQLELALAMASENREKNTLKVKSAGHMKVLDTRSIVFCKAAGDYVELMCQDKSVLYSGSLAQLQEELPSVFLKVHRSYLVNATFITGIKRKASGNGELELTDGTCVPVSRAMYAEIKSKVLEI